MEKGAKVDVQATGGSGGQTTPSAFFLAVLSMAHVILRRSGGGACWPDALWPRVDLGNRRIQVTSLMSNIVYRNIIVRLKILHIE